MGRMGLAVLVMVAAVFLSFEGGPALGAQTLPQTLAGPAGVSLAIELSKPAFLPGEAVTIRLAVSNTGSRPVRISFRPEQYGLVVEGSSGEVWRISRSALAAGPIQTITLGRGQGIVFVESWNQRNSQGLQVNPGRYRVTAIFKGSIEPFAPVGATRPAGASSLGAAAPRAGVGMGRPGDPIPVPGITLPSTEFTIQ